MTHRRHILPLLLAALTVTMLASCASQEKYAYLEGAPRYVTMPVTNNYSTTVFAGDRLHIEVFSQSPESTRPFNQEVVRVGNTDNFLRDTLRVSNTRGYLVGTDGSITFPLLGSVKVEGLTLDSVSNFIANGLRSKKYVEDAQVVTKVMNFRVTVIGEVKNPSQLHCDGNRLTVLEALAQCGDITMDAMPTCVVVVRKSAAGETVDTLDLTSRAMLESPYYYLQQNDVVYVSPTEKRRRTAWRNEDWPRYLSVGTSAVTLAYLTIYRITYSQTH